MYMIIITHSYVLTDVDLFMIYFGLDLCRHSVWPVIPLTFKCASDMLDNELGKQVLHIDYYYRVSNVSPI